MRYTTHGLMTPADMAEYRREYDMDEPTMGTGNVHDDDEESLQFADESEYIDPDPLPALSHFPEMPDELDEQGEHSQQ